MAELTSARLRRSLSAVLCAAILLPALPLAELRAADVRVVTRSGRATLPTLGTAGLNASPLGLQSAPGLLAPSIGLSPTLSLQPPALAPLPVALPVLAPQAAAPGLTARASEPGAPSVAPVAKLSEAVQAEVAGLQKPDLGAEGSSAAGQRVEDLMTGRRSASGAAEVQAGPSAAAAAAAPQVQLSPAAAPAPVKAEAPKAPAPAVQPVDSRFSYGVKRFALAAVASIFGVTASLPQAGPRLSALALKEAASKRVVFSDFDDTLGPYNSVLTPEMAAALVAVRKAGKEVAVITDRTDVSGGHQLSAFESLAAIPAADRAGMYVAAVSGGKVYRYDEQGEPVKVWEYPPFDEKRRQPVLDAIAAVKAQLPALGTSQHPGDAKNPAESWQPYSYAMMLAVGTPEAAVKKASRLFEAELKSRGMDVKVNARVPKDPANPAYIQFSIVDKSASVRYISDALGVKPWEALALGDNLYVPQSPEQPGRLARLAQRWAERLSGRPLPFTGNETDRNMEKALPGMLALSVGGSADPRLANGYVLSGRGAAASRQVLDAVASRPAATVNPALVRTAVAAAVAALVIAALVMLWLIPGTITTAAIP